MSEDFRITDRRRFPVEIGDVHLNRIYYSWEHIATIETDSKEYMVILNYDKRDFLVIETTEGKFDPITDPKLLVDITFFAQEEELIHYSTPALRINGLR